MYTNLKTTTFLKLSKSKFFKKFKHFYSIFSKAFLEKDFVNH